MTMVLMKRSSVLNAEINFDSNGNLILSMKNIIQSQKNEKLIFLNSVKREVSHRNV